MSNLEGRGPTSTRQQRRQRTSGVQLGREREWRSTLGVDSRTVLGCLDKLTGFDLLIGAVEIMSLHILRKSTLLNSERNEGSPKCTSQDSSSCKRFTPASSEFP